MKLCIVTGGTGGHIYPALAYADLFKECQPDLEVVFIGNDDRMEASLIPQAGYSFWPLHTSGLVGNALSKGVALLQTGLAFQKARGYLKKFQPDLVVGFGGYVSASVILAAQSLHIPTMIHEQNSIVGKANKLVMKKVDAIVTCYQKCDEVFPKKKTHLLGNPRATLANRSVFDADYYASLGLDPKKRTILIMMGSLGSSSVNALMKEALKDIKADDLQFLYVCGKDNANDLHMFDDMPYVHVVEYVDTLKIYKGLSGMICRAGATTIAELTALGIPSILIPSPYVANNHQFYNASVLVRNQAARIIEESDLNAQTLQQQIVSLFMNASVLEMTRQNALRLGKPNAAYDMIDLSKKCMGMKK